MTRHLRDLKDSCRFKKQKVPEFFAETFALAEEILSGPTEADATDIVKAEEIEFIAEMKLQVEAVRTKEGS